MPFSLKLTPVQAEKLPKLDAVLAAGREVMAEAVNWDAHKEYYDGKVKTFKKIAKTGGSGTNWYLRISEHGPEDGSFTDFWNGLGLNHSKNEVEYIAELNKATLLKVVDPGVSEVWSLHYAFSPPVSPRTFTSYVTCHLEAVAPRQGWIITIPTDVRKDEGLKSLEEKGVRGRYVAVERIRELGDGRVEWRMAARSDPGGVIPTFLAERAMPKNIAEDVPHFVNWLKNRRQGDSVARGASLNNAPTAGIPGRTA